MKVIAIDTLKREIEKHFCDGCRSKDHEEFKAGYCCELAEDTMNFIDALPTLEVETVKSNDEIEQAFRQGYAQAKKEAAQALDKLEDKLDQAYSDAVNDARHYYNPNVAQDALQDAYDNVECWIKRIFNGGEDGDRNVET